MPQLNNKEILECILKSTIGVISRRTSEAYANLVIGNSVRRLSEKHNFLQLVEIRGTEYNEHFDAISIKSDINNVESGKVGNAIKEFIEDISKSMGKVAGFYFIREIKGSLSFDYEKKIKEIGVDLDFLQLEFTTSAKENLKFEIDNSDILKYVFIALFEVLDREIGGDSAFKNLSEIVRRFSTEYEILNYVKINDIRAIQGVDAVTVEPEVDKAEPTKVGVAVQKCVQELNNNLAKNGFISFMEKFKNRLNIDYVFKLESLGVNFEVIQFAQAPIVKHVLKALVDVLSDYNSESDAVLIINNALKKFENNFDYLKLIKIDGARFIEGLDAIEVSPNIASVRPSELGRGLQKVIESITMSLGDTAGRHFIERFRDRLGKAYILKIEELGVNLHMIELRRGALW